MGVSIDLRKAHSAHRYGDLIVVDERQARNILWDSTSYEYDLSDCRYLFRWRWVDEDNETLVLTVGGTAPA